MVQCTSCGKPIDRIPNWMSSIKTEFVCNNCPNRTMKNIAFVSLDLAPKPVVEEEAIPPEIAETEDED